MFVYIYICVCVYGRAGSVCVCVLCMRMSARKSVVNMYETLSDKIDTLTQNSFLNRGTEQREKSENIFRSQLSQVSQPKVFFGPFFWRNFAFSVGPVHMQCFNGFRHRPVLRNPRCLFCPGDECWSI